jgi:hypothetical protein
MTKVLKKKRMSRDIHGSWIYIPFAVLSNRCKLHVAPIIPVACAGVILIVECTRQKL